MLDEVMNKNISEDKIYKYTNTDDYEKFLKRCYEEISKYTNLDKIDWITKKEL